MYSIGQVVFVILSKKNQVYPMQVVEIITKRTLQGEEVKYALKSGAENNVIMLDQIDGEVFESAEAVREVLVGRVTRQLNKMVEVAVSKAKEWYGHESNSTALREKLELSQQPDSRPGDGYLDLVVNQPPSSENSLHDNETSVMLPDGTVAKVKIPGSVTV